VDKIRRAVLRMNDLISDLLDLGKVEAGIDMAKEPCALHEIVREAAEALDGNARGKGLDLRVEIEAGLPPVLGNAGRLRQVVANLVDNAIKYTPAGGQISVSLGRQGTDLLLRVTDTGIGIAAEDQRQLFQKFYRVRTPETENIPGTGLGLAIIRSIVEQHGGQIGVKSAAGQGSTFAVTLPAGSPAV
jgi:signal transduction histidine kinase